MGGYNFSNVRPTIKKTGSFWVNGSCDVRIPPAPGINGALGFGPRIPVRNRKQKIMKTHPEKWRPILTAFKTPTACVVCLGLST